MPKRIRLRTLAAEEKVEIQRLAASRKESIRLVQRARVIAAMDEDPELTATEAGLRAGFGSNAIGPVWVKRFNEEGLAGLHPFGCPERTRSSSRRAQTDPQPRGAECTHQLGDAETSFSGVSLRVVDLGATAAGL